MQAVRSSFVAWVRKPCRAGARPCPQGRPLPVQRGRPTAIARVVAADRRPSGACARGRLTLWALSAGRPHGSTPGEVGRRGRTTGAPSNAPEPTTMPSSFEPAPWCSRHGLSQKCRANRRRPGLAHEKWSTTPSRSCSGATWSSSILARRPCRCGRGPTCSPMGAPRTCARQQTTAAGARRGRASGGGACLPRERAPGDGRARRLPGRLAGPRPPRAALGIAARRAVVDSEAVGRRGPLLTRRLPKISTFLTRSSGVPHPGRRGLRAAPHAPALRRGAKFDRPGWPRERRVLTFGPGAGPTCRHTLGREPNWGRGAHAFRQPGPSLEDDFR